jgi:hypothetical protein
MAFFRGNRSLAGSSLLLASALLLLLVPEPSQAQGVDRIWGRVETLSGEVYEGFIRWDRNEGSWVDLLNGTKDLSDPPYKVWNEATDSAEVIPDRIIELNGVRISFPDRPSGQVSSADSGIRFGHIERLVASGDDGADLILKSGEIIRLEGGSTDLGIDLREILVDRPGEGPWELQWRDLKLVDFGKAPPGARPAGERLHGTVEDRSGNQYTGYLAWDMEGILTTDILPGDDRAGRRREIPFRRITAIQPTEAGARVTLDDGETTELVGSELVDRRNDGIQISDPGLGQVEVEWEELSSARFHPPLRPVGYDAFDGGHPLRGTIVTASGKELTGRIRWDADEEYSWEILDGIRDDVVFDVEFGMISHIERFVEVGTEIESVNVGLGVRVEARRIDGVRVTLLDGRILELEGSNDVNDENKGVFVRMEGGEGQPSSEEPEWVMVRWKDFRELRLHHGEGE